MRLQTLISLHGQQGGTIHQFNYQYDTDFLAMSDAQFEAFILAIKYHKGVS